MVWATWGLTTKHRDLDEARQQLEDALKHYNREAWSHRCQITGFPKPRGYPMDGLQWKILLKMDDPHELLDWVLDLDPDWGVPSSWDVLSSGVVCGWKHFVAPAPCCNLQRPGPAVLGGRVGTARRCRAWWSAQDGGDGAGTEDGDGVGLLKVRVGMSFRWNMGDAIRHGKNWKGLVYLFIYQLFQVVFGVLGAILWVLWWRLG